MEEHLKGLNNEQKRGGASCERADSYYCRRRRGKNKNYHTPYREFDKKGVAPEKILAVTFTNKAAKEMRERIITEIEKNAKGQNSIPFVSTFHSLGVFIIKENARMLGLTKYFTILDEGDAVSIIKESLKELNIDPKQYDPKKSKVLSVEKKENLCIWQTFQRRETSVYGGIVAKVWALYEKKKMQENSLDFDDLLLKATKLLKRKTRNSQNLSRKMGIHTYR